MVDDSSQQKVTDIEKKKISGFSPLSHPIYKTPLVCYNGIKYWKCNA